MQLPHTALYRIVFLTSREFKRKSSIALRSDAVWGGRLHSSESHVVCDAIKKVGSEHHCCVIQIFSN